MTRLARRVLVWGSALLLAAALFVAAALALLLHALTPVEGEWQHRVQIGPWQRSLSMPGLIRIAMHPLAAPLIDGRVIGTRLGRWQLSRHGDDIEGHCAPCRLHIAALGPAPLDLARARVQVHHLGAGRFNGSLWLAEGAQEIVLPWTGQLDARGGSMQLTLSTTPMATLVRVFGHDLPEAAQVQVSGRLALALALRWPEGSWTAQPTLDALNVAGLGTERLRDAQLPAACRSAAGDAAVLEGWLPRALVAAEDARFHEHPGYELGEMMAAWQHNQRDGARLRGGSTLTQQLAKLAFTGDDRRASRKLRELLYAVEMERTLGKARILQLYLALAPWGEGVCGAERAAQVYLGKSAAKIGPVSAAWLVSLLPNPDVQLQALAEGRTIDRERVRQILAGMRPMSTAQRALANVQLEDWTP